MPFINVMVSEDITKEQELAVKTRLGKAISVLGKGEAYLMVNITPNCNLYFGGKNDTPIAIGELKLLGNPTGGSYERFTVEFCKIMEEELNIPKNKTYVTYQAIVNWGYNGFNF